MSRRRRTASSAGPSTRAGLRPGTRSQSSSLPALRRPAPSRRQAPTHRASSFLSNRRVLAVLELQPPHPPARLREAGWRDDSGAGRWTWHSLRHVFCTTALFTRKLDPTDVSRMAGHANYRITLDMYVGTTAGVLDRARTATE
jgi:integrase